MVRPLFAICIAMFFSTASQGQVWIDYSSLTPSGVPQSFPYLRTDGSSGSVAVSWSQSLGSQGTPILRGSGAGIGGSISPVGGILMGIQNVNVQNATWYVTLTFSQTEFLRFHNSESYANYERTFLNTNGTPWQGSPSTALLVVSGIDTSDLSLRGTSGNAGPFGYGDWTTTASEVELGYGIVFSSPPQFPNAQANGMEIALVPEPGNLWLTAILGGIPGAIRVWSQRRTNCFRFAAVPARSNGGPTPTAIPA
jgi:hypothetical protein